MPHTATHCNTLQHTATHCNTLQHTATHCNALHCITLRHTDAIGKKSQKVTQDKTQMTHSTPSCDWPRTYSCLWRDVTMSVALLICMCDRIRSYVWHDSFTRTQGDVILESLLISDQWLFHSYVWHDSFICVTWLIHMCDMTLSFEWHDSFICATWLIHMFDTTHSIGAHHSRKLSHNCPLTYSYAWHDHTYVWHNTFTRM